MIYEDHLGMIVVFLEFPRKVIAEIPDKVIIIAGISYEEFEFRKRFLGFEYSPDSIIRDVLGLYDDSFFRRFQQLLDHSPAIDIADYEIGMDIFHDDILSFPIFFEDRMQAVPYSGIIASEKMLAIAGEWAIGQIRRLDDESAIDEIDFGMHVFRAHLLIWFELDILISTKILTEDFQGILILLEFLIFDDDPNIHAACSQFLEQGFEVFVSEFVGPQV